MVPDAAGTFFHLIKKLRTISVERCKTDDLIAVIAEAVIASGGHEKVGTRACRAQPPFG